MQKTLQEIASAIGAELKGEPQLIITAVSPLDKAEKNHISFINQAKYASHAHSSQASALIVTPEIAEGLEGNLLVMKDPYLGFAKVSQLFDSTPRPQPGIHPSAVVAEGVKLGDNVSIGANVVIAEGVVIKSGSMLEAGVYIGENCLIGENTRVYPNTVLYHGVTLGRDCIIHANVVIGSDGFGYANEKGQWVKIPQVGGVNIGDEVEIGAHTAIDRGAMADTEIGRGVKLDNHIHVAHNVKIGDYTAIAGCTAIAGSAVIGKHCTIAGRVSILGHLSICDNAHITATTFVNKSITKPGAYSSGTTYQDNKSWQKSAIRFRQLDDMWRKMKQIEKEMLQMKQNRDNDNE
ncbi:UDP-3-O-(3-hydroxymyristoyl)glucosamine N-acyltransferase [Kangiella sediminilitoris]|uniref:UDP-3-O-acylglucosamine N-acyltransferase n=1 Tax=Kangiella sediminilitoris TaxID=1144748 RepID=A0A1B3BC36_9GAMM|nr:UDP-3-O-(3-hydroxymyristoyl)glucosamine N-acyltransferase [Kangiella sediminilitoris]AOE50354.1 UDP-3-O-acylglucosamine N-acyltransferase [Kangiella sediminilitoris]